VPDTCWLPTLIDVWILAQDHYPHLQQTHQFYPMIPAPYMADMQKNVDLAQAAGLTAALRASTISQPYYVLAA
jgi:hypothetical protein